MKAATFFRFFFFFFFFFFFIFLFKRKKVCPNQFSPFLRLGVHQSKLGKKKRVQVV